MTKLDKFPLPRIDDLLDQLGKSHYFTTLNLASGYWQIQVDKASREKTAFVTHEGLFEIQDYAIWPDKCPSSFPKVDAKGVEWP